MKDERVPGLSTRDLLSAPASTSLTMRPDGEVVYSPPPLPAVPTDEPPPDASARIPAAEDLVMSVEIDIEDAFELGRDAGESEVDVQIEDVPVAPPSFGPRLAAAPPRQTAPAPESRRSVADHHRKEVIPSAAFNVQITPSRYDLDAAPRVTPVGPPTDDAQPTNPPTDVQLNRRRIRERSRSDEQDLRPIYDARAELLYQEAAKAVAKRDFVTAERHLALALSYMPNEQRLVQARDKVKRLRQSRLAP